MGSFLIRQIFRYKQFVKYGISGGTAFLTDLSLLYVFTDILNIWYLFSAVLAFLFSFFVSFFLQKFWTFKDTDKNGIYRQMGVYFAVGLLNLIINTAGMYLLVDFLNIMYLIAQVIVGVGLAFGSFVIYKFVIFKRVRKTEEKKTKNILIATGIFPPDIGGPATMIEALAEDLMNNGFKVKILTYAEDSRPREEKLEVTRVDKNKKIKKLAFLYHFYRLAEWSDVIYATDTYSVGYFAYLLKKYLGKKYIIRFAGDSAWEKAVSFGWISDYIADFQKKKYNKEVEKLKQKRNKILFNADKVIAVSDFLAEILELIGTPKEKIKVIYNSVDFIREENISESEAEKIRSRYGENSKIIMTACRLTPWKGVEGLLKIMPRLNEKIGDINFLILGEGEEKNKLIELSEKLNLKNTVHFLGKIDHEEVLNYYKAADLFVLNTNYEGLSHTLLEVMRVGTPIVATNAGGNPEVIENGENGLLVNYNNTEELFNACLKVLEDKNLGEKFASKAKEKLEKFKWENTVRETANVLNNYV